MTPPFESTVAMPFSELLQLTLGSVAFDGVTAATSLPVSPSVRVRLVLSRATPVTDILADLTAAEQDAVFPPSAVMTLIVVTPSFNAFTSPLFTEATVASVLVQVTAPFVASAGSTVAMRITLSPSVSAIEFLSSLTPVTAMLLLQPEASDRSRKPDMMLLSSKRHIAPTIVDFIANNCVRVNYLYVTETLALLRRIFKDSQRDFCAKESVSINVTGAFRSSF